VLRKGRDVAAEAVVSAEAAQEAAAEIQAEEVLPKLARKGGHPVAILLELMCNHNVVAEDVHTCLQGTAMDGRHLHVSQSACRCSTQHHACCSGCGAAAGRGGHAAAVAGAVHPRLQGFPGRAHACGNGGNPALASAPQQSRCAHCARRCQLHRSSAQLVSAAFALLRSSARSSRSQFRASAEVTQRKHCTSSQDAFCVLCLQHTEQVIGPKGCASPQLLVTRTKQSCFQYRKCTESCFAAPATPVKETSPEPWGPGSEYAEGGREYLPPAPAAVEAEVATFDAGAQL
jgi:hypothetical protein